MQYSILDTLIPMPESHRLPLLTTLALYDKGEDLSNSPLIQSRINLLHQDCYANKKSIYDRQEDFIALYENIKQNGYNGSPLWIYFDESGQIRLYDGFHRLAILLHLGLNIEVLVTTDWKGIDETIGKDFPLIEVLKKQPPLGEALYQPVDDSRVKGWYVDRPDSSKRLEYLLEHLVGNTVLDIGCSEGYFSRELSKRGYKVTAIDHSPGLIAVARYLSIINNLNIEFHCGEWYDIVQGLGKFDNILMLSVIHNDMKVVGVGCGIQKLWALNRKAKRLFLEVPNNDNERQWNKEGYPNWDFHNLLNIKKLEIILGMDCVRDYYGNRSIFTFSDEPSNNITVDTKHGFPITLSKDEKYITPWILELHDWEPETTQFIKDNLKSGQTFVDVGANAGYFTILASKIVGDTGKVYAFEPASDAFELLRHNTKGLNNIEIIQKALSDHEGTSNLYGGKSSGERGLQGIGSIKELVEVTTLDSYNLSPNMIKIDTEGTEADVIKGAVKTITPDTILIVEDNDSSIQDFEVMGQASCWKPLNRYLRKSSTPMTYTIGLETKYHLLGLAHTKTNKDYIPCAITQNVFKVAQMLTSLKYPVYHYGAEGSNPPCVEHIDCISDKGQLALYGDKWKTGFFEYSKNDAVYQKFNQRAIEEIRKRMGPRDILLIFNGNAQEPIAKALNMMTVEASVGYEGVFTDKRIFESYAWMHYIYGCLNRDGGAPDGRYYDAVIPLAVDPADFIYRSKKDDYFLYAGRLIQRKGVHIAQQVVDKIGSKLYVMGQGETKGVIDDSPNVKRIGVVSIKERAKLMAGARALFAPTIYLEPFGAIVIEAAMCGTPVISTDWGAFPETVVHGVTGYRCRTFDDFVFAAKNVDKLKSEDCRKYAMKNYSLSRVGLMYQEYFTKLLDLFGKGWYAEHTERKELNWLRKY